MAEVIYIGCDTLKIKVLIECIGNFKISHGTNVMQPIETHKGMLSTIN